jgi:hypothetical protein
MQAIRQPISNRCQHLFNAFPRWRVGLLKTSVSSSKIYLCLSALSASAFIGMVELAPLGPPYNSFVLFVAPFPLSFSVPFRFFDLSCIKHFWHLVRQGRRAVTPHPPKCCTLRCAWRQTISRVFQLPIFNYDFLIFNFYPLTY